MSSSELPSLAPYSTITVSEVTFTGNTGPVQAESVPPFAFHSSLTPGFSTEEPAFVVGIHAVDPPIGSGDPQSLDSLIGLKILPTGEFQDIEVPIFLYRPDIRPGQVFPPTPNGTTTIEGTLWHDIGLDYGATQGVIQIDGEMDVQANITDLDQNPNRDPIGLVPRDPVWEFVGSVGPSDFDSDDNPAFGTSVAGGERFVVGAPLENHSPNVGSTYVLNGIFEEIEPGTAGLGDDQIKDGAQFGSAVATFPAADVIAVGAPNDDGGSGVVYVFFRDSSGTLQLQETISGDSPGDDLGTAVELSPLSDGIRVLSGAPNAGNGGEVKVTDILVEDSQSGITTTIESNSTLSPPSEAGPDAEFGSSIAVGGLFEFDPGSGQPALIGAPGTTVETEGGLSTVDDAGAAYLFDPPHETSSSMLTEIQNPDPEAGEGARFGSDVAISLEDEIDEQDLLLIVGAPGVDDGKGEVSRFAIDQYLSDDPGTVEEDGAVSDERGRPSDRLGAAVSLNNNQNVVAGAPGGGYATLLDEFGVRGRFTRPGDSPSFGAAVSFSIFPPMGIIGAPDADGGGAVYIYEPPGGGGPF